MRKTLQLSLIALALAAPSAFAASGASCTSTGSTTVSSTIKVTSTTYDGGCKTFNATSALGSGNQAEGQSPYFRVTSGTLKNVILGSNGADGIHTYGNATLNNITWKDVGEDAMTIKTAGTVTITNFTGSNAADKFFQVNAAATFTASNGIIKGAMKSFRQNGGTSYKTVVNFNNVDQSNVTEAVFRTDSSTSTAKWTTGKASSVKSVCRGYASGKCSISGVTGVTKVNY